MPTEAETIYRCPGEPHPIDRVVHLGRLASFYSACRNCPHRDDTAGLPAEQVRQLLATHHRAEPLPLFVAEGLSGVCMNELTAGVVRQFAQSFGICLLQQHIDPESPPTIVAGGDGRALTAELFAAASEGLRFTGCRVVEIGEVTSGCLSAATNHLGADGGLFIGNPRGEPHTAGVKVWGPSTCPWSAGDGLDSVEQMYRRGVVRPVRRFGRLERFNADELYLSPLRNYFHALRPLRFVLDTSSYPITKYLQRLLHGAACEVLRPGEPRPERRPNGSVTGDRLGERTLARIPAGRSFLERRLDLLREQVLSRHAHFAVWIDGDGEVCRLLDERGRIVRPEHLLILLARHLLEQSSDAAFVLEQDASPSTVRQLTDLGARLHLSRPTRQAMATTIAQQGAIAGGGPSGRFWFRRAAASADALQTLSMLLTAMSQSDRPLSEVLDAASVTG